MENGTRFCQTKLDIRSFRVSTKWARSPPEAMQATFLSNNKDSCSSSTLAHRIKLSSHEPYAPAEPVLFSLHILLGLRVWGRSVSFH
jgi:hypothetical protein